MKAHNMTRDQYIDEKIQPIVNRIIDAIGDTPEEVKISDVLTALLMFTTSQLRPMTKEYPLLLALMINASVEMLDKRIIKDTRESN
jgi:hypothetical protein